MPDQEDPRCWIVQRCTQKLKRQDAVRTAEGYLLLPLPELEYEDWPGYDTPMTHTEMEAALELCEKLWPEHEFRGHRISRLPSGAGTTPGSSAKSEGPGISQEGQ
jgi:hypothetical protein